MSGLHDTLLRWYDVHARSLPWREPSASPWAVMVSEFMLQQTPVSRVLPVYEQWLERWPTPADLAVEPTGEAVRMWGRLGYPRRALRLHAAATAIVAEHDGQVPSRYEDLIALTGVGDYTASAIAVFAFGARHAVLDTNVRRVLARALDGVEHPPSHVTVAERRRAEGLLPASDAPTWSVAVMELGALVCTSAKPICDRCPIVDRCAWMAAGRPAHAGKPRKAQRWDGTDRQCRGRLLAVLRDSSGPVHRSSLDLAWPQEQQRVRCLASLIEDSLVVEAGGDCYALP